MQKKIQLSLVLAALTSSLYATSDLTLEPITVTSATKSKQSIDDVTSNVEVISAEELQEKHITTVKDALRTISGVSTLSNGGVGSSSSVMLRGMNNNRTLVLIDGIRFQDPSSTSGANISHLMATDIQRIEVIKGAQSGIWGADASAGVINIITKDAKKGFSVSGDIEYGSFKTKKYGASISHRGEKLELKLSANRVTADSFSVQSPRGDNLDDYEDDSYKNTTVNLKAAYQVNNNIKIKFNLTDIDALKEYDSYGDADDTDMKSDIDNQLYSITYLHTIGDHDISFKYEKSEFYRDEIGTVAQWGSEYVKQFNGDIENIELSDKFSYKKDSFLLFGGGKSADDVEYTLTDKSKKDKENKNEYLYLTNSSKLGSLILTQSIRHDNYNNFNDKTTYKLGARYNFNNELYLSSNFGTGYNVPNIVQELNPWGATNNALNPENTKSIDVTIGYKALTLTYFHQKIEDLIEWYDPDGWGGNPAIYKNLDGKSTFKGVELSYKQNITQDIAINSNFTYLSAKDDNGEELARRPKRMLNLGVDYYGFKDLHIGVYGEYTGRRYDKANREGEQTGKYAVVNAVVNYEINKNLNAYVKIDNMFDRYYQVVDGFATAPRSAYLGLKADF